MRIALLDDYQRAALTIADWNSLKPRVTEVVSFPELMVGNDLLASKLADFECIGLMRERTPFPADLINRLPKLKLLLTSGVRNASIDVDACTKRGIQVCGTESLSPPTVELAWALILACARHIPFETQAVREGRWQTTYGTMLHGKTLAMLGLGRLGADVAKIGKAFSMNIIAWSANLTAERCAEIGAKLVDKATLFKEADFMSIHLVLGDRSRNLVGAAELASMKKTAWLINTSRGPIVNEAALIAALRNKQIAGAGLDVFDQEPLPVDHPFRKLDNVVATPHLGYVAEEGYRQFYGQMVEDTAAYLDGKVLRPINKL